MKKLIFTFFIGFSGAVSYGQTSATMQNDTLFYSGNKFYKGMPLSLGFGTGTNNDFTFVKAINTSMNFINCPAEYAKAAGIVSRVYMDKGIAKVSLAIPNVKYPLSIQIEPAIDKKEVVF
jgi:hypothetical protein